MVKVFVNRLDCLFYLRQLENSVVVIVFAGKRVPKRFLRFSEPFYRLSLHLAIRGVVRALLRVGVDLVGTDQRVETVDTLFMGAGSGLIIDDFPALFGLDNVSCQLL